MSSVESNSILKIFCSGCSQKLDVSEFKSFSSFQCPVCNNNLVVPKKAGDIFLTKKLSSHGGFDSYLGVKDDKQIVAKVSKINPEADPTVVDGMEKISDFDPGFKILENSIQRSTVKKNTEDTKKEATVSKEKAVSTSKNKVAEKSKKTAPSKSKKKSLIPSSNGTKAQLKPTRIKRKSKSSSNTFVILGVVAAFVVLAIIGLSGSSTGGKDKLSAGANETKKESKEDLTRERKLKKQQELAQQKELEKEQKLAQQKELEKEQELAKKQKEAKQLEIVRVKEEEKQRELDGFLALINPSEEQRKKFEGLPKVSSANLGSLLNKHCTECHSSKKRKGDLALDIFKTPTSIYRYFDIVKDAYESVKFGDMPPEDEDISDEERAQLTAYFEKTIFTLESKQPNINTTALIRRLTPYEYDYTVRAVTGLDLKLGESFPGDGGGNQGFSNDASLMNISPLLMEKYIAAAENLSSYSYFDVDEGFAFSSKEVSLASAEVFEKQLKVKMYRSLPPFYSSDFSVEKYLPRLMKAISEFSLNTKNRDSVEAVASRNKINPEFLKNGIKYFTTSVNKSSEGLKALKKWRSLRKGSIEDKDLNEAVNNFINGYKASSLFLLNRQSRDRYKHVGLVKNVENIFHLNPSILVTTVDEKKVKEYAKYLAIYNFSRFSANLRGSAQAYSHIKPLVQDFLYKMHRRPPNEKELGYRVQDFLNDSLKYGFPYAARVLVISEFSSFNFLFRIENKRSSTVDDHDLASRLSYFLWASPPDAELIKLATAGELKKEKVLLEQVERMLRDKKSAKLAKHFADQWLHISDIYEADGPSQEVYKGFDRQLAEDMWQETAMSFNYIVKNNRSILELISSDYTFVNNRLSEIYGLGQGSSSFKKVTVRNGQRGGILGHAGFLTMTSLPQRTSPIVRGNWIISVLLGTPTPPPPDNVPLLPEEEVVTENFTLKQQLAKHRNVAACIGCHKKIDPLGIALENYDSVGRWRDRYKKSSIDSEAKIDGQVLNGAQGLKKYLLDNKIQFVRNLSQKLLSYGLGRSLYFYDNYLVNKMIENSIRNDYSFTSLVKTIVLSPQFQQK